MTEILTNCRKICAGKQGLHLVAFSLDEIQQHRHSARHDGHIGRLAQRESTAFTRQGSLVQSQYRPPSTPSNIRLKSATKSRNLDR